MSSRLCKVFLVNAKTSGSTTSGRICEIDPRGGAAITGANGAGKTTTLQVIALFFGYSPGQLIQQGENREAMLRFILPHPESALVFEYQRGDGPQDVCHVILRRESNSDVGEYRFVHGPMQVDLLVAQDTVGQSVFLDDEGTREAAARLGLGDEFSRKLNLAAYRSVILNVPGTGKDDIHRRNLAQRFSFSRQRLTNLDRLVAAIVKERIEFTDFADVAAQIVMDQLGVSSNRPAGSKNLQLRQSKQQIEQWLRDRDAVERAIHLEPEVKQLRELISQFRTLEMKLAEKRADCVKLTSLNEAAIRQAEADKADLSEKCAKAEAQFNLRKSKLQQALQDAQVDAILKANLHGNLLQRRDYLEENDASEWAQKALGLEGLKGSASTLQELVETISNIASGVVNNYAEKLRTVEGETNKRVERMRGEFDKINSRVHGEVATLEEQEKQSLALLEPEWAQMDSDAGNHVEDCITNAAEAKAQLQRPRIDAALEERLEEARQANASQQQAIIDANREVTQAQELLTQAERQWRQAEGVHRSQKELHAAAQASMASIRARLQPPAGSLHAALLANGDDDWKNGLAKVISPDLLLREDLQPHKVSEDSLLYGWGLDLDSIERPAWVEQDALHKQLEEAARATEAAKLRLDETHAAFEAAEEVRQKAQEALGLAQARESVVASKSKDFASQLKAVEDAAAAALIRVREEAGRASELAEQALVDARAAGQAVKRRIESQRAGKREEFSQQRDQARQRGARLHGEVEERIRAFQAQQKATMESIEQARDKELSAKGVDTVKLANSRKELEHLRSEIREIEDKGALVREWQAWLNEQGPICLIDASAVKDKAQEFRDQSEQDLKKAEQEARDEKSEFTKAEGKIASRIYIADSELSILRGLAVELGDFAISGLSSKTLSDMAGGLKGEVKALLDEYARKRQALRTKLERVERSLTEGESSTRDFVHGVIREVANDAQDIERAAALARVYDRIRTDVLHNVNTSLKTMLENIASYRKTIWDFESEVRKFNNKLQDGLSLVSRRFARFAEFKVSVVTDFDKIDFIGKLKVLDDAINDHRDRNVATYTIEPPPASTAQALRSFMTALDKGSVELNLGDHITLSGSVIDDGVFKQFHSAKELEKISSNGLTAIALISLLSGLLNVIRGQNEIYIPWATDEVGRFDGSNFHALMEMMAENRIDPVTASPALTPAAYSYFKHRYVFKPHGVIAEYRPRIGTAQPTTEVVT